MDYKEKYGAWAVVTGASSGIGEAFSNFFAKNGMDIVLISNEDDELKIVSKRLEQEHKISTITLCVDLSDPARYTEITPAIQNLDIGVLANNVSFGRSGDFLNFTMDEYSKMIELNAHSYIWLTYMVLPKLIKKNKGALLFTSSMNAMAPNGGSAVYTATKGFELYFGCALWDELKNTKIDVLNVLPGPTRTRFQERAGTTTAKIAMSAQELVEGMVPFLGKEMFYIPGQKNRLLAKSMHCFSFTQKVKLASHLHHYLLHENPKAGFFRIMFEGIKAAFG
ncbi:MAG: SDR family NAD(P)-dependent oxidoreductase [Magnetococcales bacterium]|nr:SDR family NAD(P)-dependent oxidoreductase [Magnetococcales bacterium]